MIITTPVKIDRPQSIHNESNIYVWVERTLNPRSAPNSREYRKYPTPHVSRQLMFDIYDNDNDDDYETYPVKFNKEADVKYISSIISKLFKEKYGKGLSTDEQLWTYAYWNLEYYAYIINKAATIAPEEVRESVILFNHCSKEMQAELLFNWIDLVVRKNSEENDNSHDKKEFINEEKDFDKEAIKIVEQLEKV